MIFLHYLTTEIDSFPMSVAKNFCDQPLRKYIDSKTVLIYRPHPVLFICSFGCADVVLIICMLKDEA